LKLERVQFGLLAAVAGTCLVSIFAAQVCLGLAIAVFGLRWAIGATSFPRLGLDGPTLAFSVWSLLAAAFSVVPVESHQEVKKVVLFLLLYLVVDATARGERRERLADSLLLGGLALASGMLLQFYFLGFDTLHHRPPGLQGHYMTASGLVMSALVLAMARLAFARQWPRPPRRNDLGLVIGVALGLTAVTIAHHVGLFAIEVERLFVAGLALAAAWFAGRRGTDHSPDIGLMLSALVAVVATWALLLSRTRSAWLGALAGLVVVAVLRAPRLLYALAAFVAAVLVVRPGPVVDRLTLSDRSSSDRYYMWQAGLDMIAEKPIFGHGPGMILRLYPHYRWPKAPNPDAPHLHDNALQIAAERGLPCLVWWLWWLVRAVADSWREYRRAVHPESGPASSPWPAAASLGLLAAISVAGLFEYNFGDSEVLMFSLVTLALPYSVGHARQLSRA